jgi:hypothetical protein
MEIPHIPLCWVNTYFLLLLLLLDASVPNAMDMA